MRFSQLADPMAEQESVTRGARPVPELYFGEGCPECRGTGLLGRIGVFEMLDVGRRVQGLIRTRRDANEITDAARIEGMASLRECAIRRLAEGVTTFEEIIRITAERQ